MARSILIASVFIWGFAVAAGSSWSQQLDRHLAGGEFAAAARSAEQLPADARDVVLAKVASAQSSSGESVAAAGTIRGIRSLPSRQNAIDGASGAAGGGSFADFQSLIDLIQTTVVPDTWEALGGPSTMSEYAAGVYVDAEGTVRQCEAFAKTDAVSDFRLLLSKKSDAIDPASDAMAWRRPAAMRCVSLRRLMDELVRLRIDGVSTSEPMIHMAGLSRIQYLFIDDDDIVIAGPVGGIDSAAGWYRDRVTGSTALRLDFFLTCLSSALAGQPFGCTIDPTTEGLKQAAVVASGVKNDTIPVGKAADEMISALGMQRVEVFGTAGDSTIGHLMVEADRHMKQLALGMHPMPRGASNYLDVVDASLDRGLPNDLLLRLWFTAAPRAVRADGQREIFEISGTPIRLSGQNERAMATGQRGNLTVDFRSVAFVADFNKNWKSIRSKYPIYSALESIFRVASVSELLRRYADSPQQVALINAFADNASSWPSMQTTPRQVLSIAKLHSVRRGRKVYHLLMASGGVAVDARETLVTKITDYPSLRSIATRPVQSRPRVIQRWWWDAAR